MVSKLALANEAAYSVISIDSSHDPMSMATNLRHTQTVFFRGWRDAAWPARANLSWVAGLKKSRWTGTGARAAAGPAVGEGVGAPHVGSGNDPAHSIRRLVAHKKETVYGYARNKLFGASQLAHLRHPWHQSPARPNPSGTFAPFSAEEEPEANLQDAAPGGTCGKRGRVSILAPLEGVEDDEPTTWRRQLEAGLPHRQIGILASASTYIQNGVRRTGSSSGLRCSTDASLGSIT